VIEEAAKMSLIKGVIISVFVLALVACEDSTNAQTGSPDTATTQTVEAGSELTLLEATEEEPTLTETERMEQSLDELEEEMGFNMMKEAWTGDLDVIAEQRIIRVLTVYGLGRYFLDGGQEKGITYELFKMFEDFINKELGNKHLRVHVVFMPVSRDQLIPALISGRGDIAAAGLTITPERDEVIDFSNPISRELSEIFVTGPSAPQIEKIEDLSGHTIYVRASSSYHASLETLNQQFRQQGLEEIIIEEVNESLEDSDILEMVNAGLVEWAVVDNYKAEAWATVFENLTVRNDLVFRSGGHLGFAFRENSPQLAAQLNEFLKTHKQGTLKGNILINRYIGDFDWAQNALGADEYKRFQDVIDIFSKFGNQYGVDYLMVAAQGYQESRLDQNAKSGAGAVGIMQLLPSTAADANVGIPDISTAESNIHAGIKYLDFIRKRYFSDPGMDKFNQTMFAFAAYNAGPARIRKLRGKAVDMGYDPNIWFDNVEVMAAKEIGRETVQYVANILKYYVAYRLTLKQQLQREQAREQAHENAGEKQKSKQ
jgi:membrane-bound lytic murein transglycosylase MltF